MMTAEDLRAYKADWMRQRRNRWRNAGNCQECGIPVEKYTRCSSCRAKRAPYDRERQRMKRVAA